MPHSIIRPPGPGAINFSILLEPPLLATIMNLVYLLNFLK